MFSFFNKQNCNIRDQIGQGPRNMVLVRHAIHKEKTTICYNNIIVNFFFENADVNWQDGFMIKSKVYVNLHQKEFMNRKLIRRVMSLKFCQHIHIQRKRIKNETLQCSSMPVGVCALWELVSVKFLFQLCPPTRHPVGLPKLLSPYYKIWELKYSNILCD